MRTIFPMIKLIDDVEKYAKKDYWILNYSNPAAIVSLSLIHISARMRWST